MHDVGCHIYIYTHKYTVYSYSRPSNLEHSTRPTTLWQKQNSPLTHCTRDGRLFVCTVQFTHMSEKGTKNNKNASLPLISTLKYIDNEYIFINIICTIQLTYICISNTGTNDTLPKIPPFHGRPGTRDWALRTKEQTWPNLLRNCYGAYLQYELTMNKSICCLFFSGASFQQFKKKWLPV